MNKMPTRSSFMAMPHPAIFVTEKEETLKLISALRNGRHITLMSPRRMGKTGLSLKALRCTP